MEDKHVKDPYNGMEVAIVGKITGHFSSTVAPFIARFWSRRQWTWRHLAVKVGTSKE
jgi:hypothetical protein